MWLILSNKETLKEAQALARFTKRAFGFSNHSRLVKGYSD